MFTKTHNSTLLWEIQIRHWYFIPPKIIFRPFRKKRNAIISFIMPVCLSVRPSVCLGQLGSHRTRFPEIQFFMIFSEFVKKTQVLLKCNMTNGTLREDQYIFSIIFPSVLLRVKNVPDKRCRENSNTFYIQLHVFRKSCRVWDNKENIVQADK